ncbi:MAG: hypothetical protein OHK0012_21590 [Synechococcales cyanobacterium]
MSASIKQESILSYEHRLIRVAQRHIDAAGVILRSLGVSTYLQAGMLKALIRLGRAGAADRLAIHHTELRFAPTRDQRIWLELCWQLPTHTPPQSAPKSEA